jgi:uncharacterized protein YecE (DUF72 family)
MPGKAYIGTSGWNYKSWRDGFYENTPQKQWLRSCAERFTGIEVNGTFYRLQEKSTFKKWREETPDNFPFAIKGHRYVTHNKKLLDVEESVIRLSRVGFASRQTARRCGVAASGSFEKRRGAVGEVRQNSAALG